MADTPYPFEVKKVYSFTLYPATVMPGDFTNVTVMAIMDYDSALQFADIPAIHPNVFPYLPSGTPNDPTQYDYLKVKLSSGVVTVLGIPWINEATIALVRSLTANVVIEGVSNNDAPRILAALVQNGFNNVNVKIVSA
jgi:hypothetical protein